VVRHTESNLLPGACNHAVDAPATLWCLVVSYALYPPLVQVFSPLFLFRFTFTLQIAQMVKESQRFQPSIVSLSESSLDDDEDISDIDSPPADDYIVNVGDLEDDEDEDAGIEDDGEPPAWYATQQRIVEVREKYRRHETDTGSPEFQVAGMTERISYLTSHLQQHPKDFSTRRGLVALVNKRRRLLNYLHRENVDKYYELVASLGVRHKAPSNVDNNDDKYGRYPQQKAIKKHLVKGKGKRK
jgi:small subunit ribosomal protein S15